MTCTYTYKQKADVGVRNICPNSVSSQSFVIEIRSKSARTDTDTLLEINKHDEKQKHVLVG